MKRGQLRKFSNTGDCGHPAYLRPPAAFSAIPEHAAQFALHYLGEWNLRKCVIRPEKNCDAVNQQPAVAKGHSMFGVRFPHTLRC